MSAPINHYCPKCYLHVVQNFDMLFRKQWPNENDVVEGKAAAVIGTGVTLGNIVMTAVVGLVTRASTDTSVLMLIPCSFSALTSLLVLCTNMPTIKS